MRRAVVVLAIAMIAPAARANGRFPATNSITLQKGNTASLTVGSTFGLVLSRDDGAHFWWVCEQAVGYNGTFDPSYAVARDGTLYAGTPDGLRVSRDQGCTFDTVLVEPQASKQKWIDAIDLGPGDEVGIAQAEGGMTNDVFESTDGGHGFQAKGLASATAWWNSVKVAPSNAMRVYVTGYQVTQTADDGGTIPPRVFVKRSDDGGTSWNDLATTDFAVASNPLVVVAAVSPSNPDLLYARSIGADPPTGDKLYVSQNAGASWQRVLDTTDAIRGVVFLANGGVLVGTTNGGVFQSTSGTSFTQLSNEPEMACVAQREDGAIFSCGANWDPDNFALGKSTGASVGPFTKVFRFVELAGPLSCPAGTVQHDTCELQLWPALKEQFGIKDPIVDGAPPDAATPPPKKSTGCCDSSGSGVETAVVLVLAIGIGALLVRRGRKKRKCCE